MVVSRNFEESIQIIRYYETLYIKKHIESIIIFRYCESLREGRMMQKIRLDMDLGHNIQSMRYSCKLTQDQVVAQMNLMGINISKSTYAKLETNRMNIKVSELVALAVIFQTDMNSLFQGLYKS